LGEKQRRERREEGIRRERENNIYYGKTSPHCVNSLYKLFLLK
jgi:hypothetical protein